jgi:hypothetical protein
VIWIAVSSARRPSSPLTTGATPSRTERRNASISASSASPWSKESSSIDTCAGDSTGAYAAWNGERLGLAWCEDIDGQSEIFTQAFDTRGGTRSPARRVTETATQSSIPAIRPWRQGFALAWNEYRASSAEGHPVIVESNAVLSLIR